MLRNMPQLTGNSDEDIIVLYDYVLSLRREIYDTLNNLDDDNFAKITAKSIETSTLVVGDNIEMGPNAILSWEQVDGRPNTTYIGPDGLYTGWIQAEQITAGTIDASEIDVINLDADNIVAGTLSASRIDTANLYAERIKQSGYPSNYGIIGGPLGGLALYHSGDHYFSIYKGAVEAYFYAMGNSFLSSSDYATYAYDNWDFSNASVSGLDDYALVNHDHASKYIKNYTPSDNISISATEFGIIVRDGSTILGQIDYTV
jgi:hypothetical protein